MPGRRSRSVHAELIAFLAAGEGTVQSADVGALLGQAALLSEQSTLAERLPAGWHAKVNAALPDAAVRAGPPRARSH